MKTHLALPPYLKILSVLAIVIILSYGLIVLENIIVPLFFGFLLAFLLVPICSFFEKKCKLSRTIVALVVIMLFVLIICAILLLVGSQMSNLTQDLPAFKIQLKEGIEMAQEWIFQKFGIARANQLDYIEQVASNSMQASSDILGKAFSSISTVLMYLFFSLLYALFLLIYRRHLVKFVVISFGEKHKQTVFDIAAQIQNMVKKYIIGLLIQMVIVTVLSLIAFTMLGLKYSFLLALITGMLNILPYIGIFTAMLICVLITFATSTTSTVLLVLVAYFVIHAIDGNLIMPTIVGSKVKVNSLVVILGLVLGQMAWGIVGMILTIPTLAILKIIFDHIEALKPFGFLLGEGDAKTEKQV